MSNLAKEVAEELKGAGLSWWQRASLIVAANVVGLVLGAIVIAAGGIVWNKAMSTDDIKEDLVESFEGLQVSISTSSELAKTERTAIIDELSKLGVENDKLKSLVEAYREESKGGEDSQEGTGFFPSPVPPGSPAPQQAVILEPSAKEVNDRRAEIQQRIDKDIYRMKERTPKK